MNVTHENYRIDFYFKESEQLKKDFQLSAKNLLLPLIDAIKTYQKKRQKNLNEINHFFLTLHYVDGKKIKQLNSKYRGKNKITDVLSFPVHENLRKNKVALSPLDLGDIFICRTQMLRQAKEFSISARDEFFHLAVHGFLHLLGYDHELSAREEKLMEKKEIEIIRYVRASNLRKFK